MHFAQILLVVKVLQRLMVTARHKLLLNQVMLPQLQCLKDHIKFLVIRRPFLSCNIELFTYILNWSTFLRKNDPYTLIRSIILDPK